jgi:hypothetical protein
VNCIKCGKELSAEANYCSRCGKEVGSNSEALVHEGTKKGGKEALAWRDKAPSKNPKRIVWQFILTFYLGASAIGVLAAFSIGVYGLVFVVFLVVELATIATCRTSILDKILAKKYGKIALLTFLALYFIVLPALIVLLQYTNRTSYIPRGNVSPESAKQSSEPEDTNSAALCSPEDIQSSTNPWLAQYRCDRTREER